MYKTFVVTIHDSSKKRVAVYASSSYHAEDILFNRLLAEGKEVKREMFKVDK
jgi:hypothetical protein